MRARLVRVMLCAVAALVPTACRAASPEPRTLPVLTGAPPSVMPALPDSTPVQAAPVEPKPRECPKTPYVNCMPPIGGSQRPLCGKDYKEWAKTHCPGVEYVY